MSERWVAVDVDYFRNPKARRAGAHGRALHLASICYSGGLRTDGHLPPEALDQLLIDAGAPRRAVALVVDAGLWLPNGSGWDVHDYHAWQETKAESLERSRALSRASTRRWRDRQRGDRHGDEG